MIPPAGRGTLFRTLLEPVEVTTEVPMPQMGESIAEGTLVKWHKKVGDKVLRDEPLFEISTDKVDTEIPAPQDGYLLRVLVKEGETVPVHTTVCVIGDGSAPEQAGDAGEAREAREEQEARDAQVGADGRRSAASTASTIAGKADAPVATRTSGSAESPAAASATAATTAEEGLRARSSPLVRRLAAEHGIDLATLAGSGTAGRVTKEDILRRIEETRAGAATPAPGSTEDRVEPMTVMRQQIAEHMLASRRTSAHVTSVFEVDMTEVRAARDALAPGILERHGVKLTYMPFIVQAAARSLRRFPDINASVEGKSVRYHDDVNIGVAVALDEGLIVPVLRQADRKSISETAVAIADLAQRARSKRLRPEEVRGGTFTITNPGVFGSLFGTPIIHQPQVAILGVGAVTKRAVVLEDADAIAVRSMAFLSLSFDHRLIDGALADRFLADLKAGLEKGGFSE
ncbi:MAG: 2-oxo acid dehydrogenase subunit E2 [Planctomycetes bacterium]|nr:2-oxo acid dehydrogenase subunit E2 [Planctomycetota bacterium]